MYIAIGIAAALFAAYALIVRSWLVLALGAVTRQDVLDLPKGEKIARMLHLH